MHSRVISFAHVRETAPACMQVRRQFYVYLCVHACSDTRAKRVLPQCVCFMVHLTFSGAFAFCNLGITTNAAPIKKMIREQRTSFLHEVDAQASLLQKSILYILHYNKLKYIPSLFKLYSRLSYFCFLI
jgi:hypothetical protein